MLASKKPDILNLFQGLWLKGAAIAAGSLVAVWVIVTRGKSGVAATAGARAAGAAGALAPVI